MYQLSKNLNRPFFIDFLTAISVKYVKNDLSDCDTDPEDTGDSILTMLLKPSYTTQVVMKILWSQLSVNQNKCVFSDPTHTYSALDQKQSCKAKKIKFSCNWKYFYEPFN